MHDKSEPPSVVLVTEYVDEHGRRVKVYSPAWAEGATPGPSAGGGEHINIED